MILLFRFIKELVLYSLQISKFRIIINNMEGLSSLTSSVLTAVKSRTILVVHVSVLGVGWAILQHVYLIRFYICFKFVTTEILLI